MFLHVRYYIHLHWHLSLFHLWFELHIVLLNLHLHSHETYFFVLFILLSISNTLTFVFFVLSWTLKLPLHLSRLILNGKYFSSTRFKSVRVGLITHDLLFNYTNLVAKDPLKLNNLINTCLISHNIT